MILVASTVAKMTKQISNISGSCPLITVGIACYNATETIERAIASALAQDWPDFEVLVVDDGSTDESIEILDKLVLAHKRLRVIKYGRNQGCASARNTLIEESRGEFLAFFDDDDVSRFDRLRLQYNRIISYEKKAETRQVACYASGEKIYPNGYILPIHSIGSEGLPPTGSAVADYLLFNKREAGFFYGGGPPTCSLMARTTVLRDLGGFDISMRRQEDVDFAIRLSFKGGHFIGISEPVLSQYATFGTEKSAKVEFESFLQLLDKNANYLHASGSYHYMRLWSEMRYRHFAGDDMHAVMLLLRLLLFYPLRTPRHFLRSATRRFLHEQKMKA